MSTDSIFSASKDPGMDKYNISRDLLDAASYGIMDKIKECIAAGADLDFSPNGVSPTSITVTREYLLALQVLVSSGARSDIKNRMGWTAIHQAAEKENGMFLDAILSNLNGTNLKVKDEYGTTILNAALTKNMFDNADKIYKVCPELIHELDADGVNLTLQAVINRNSEMLEWCLKKGIPVDKADGSGVTAQSAAVKWQKGFELICTVKPDAKIELENVKTEVKEDKKEDVVVEEEVVANPFGLSMPKPKPPAL